MKDELKHRHIPAEQLRNETVNQVVKENRGITSDINEMIRRVGKQFTENKLLTFPKLCIEARRVNYLKMKEFMELDNPGGWSEDRKFKFDYVVPRELYLFMINMVYRNFWSDENKKVWKSFMRAVCRGDEPMALLRKVKVYYLGAQDE